ncbi:PTS sugar transporter subunit IIA [Oceanotoga sp. DSM 15011]|uniref:PTS sugar transporter subunit IIA n=1 Tax=Oceanotoga sp. DSM 15011 TaxID=2984951 RepID=UPI0021F4DE7B|nr:PTS sugar transporter subunit IIA [Oceanotoga sp. DSM 15011]UYP01254.1 PTS sugar transporter subunit IIA [Oceanotoga sp. DSM 15011]
MLGIILVSHGNFANGILSSAEMIIGKQKYVDIVNFVDGESLDDLDKKIHSSIDKLRGLEGIFILCDIVGGSPFKQSSIISLKYNNVRVVGGINLPILLEVFMNRMSSIDENLSIMKKEFPNTLKEFNLKNNKNNFVKKGI